MKLDTEADNVWEVEIPVEKARKLLDIDLPEELEELYDAIDSAQGEVFGKQKEVSYIVIKIVP